MNPDQRLLKRIEALEEAFARNNFSNYQDFNKYCNFTSRLKVPHYTSTPATCEAGEVCEVGGKLYVASAANTWVVAGTQS